MSRIAWAQAYPTRPVRVIIPFAAAGPTDVFARLVAQKLSERLGKMIGFDYFEKPEPPYSQDLEKAWRPYVETCIAATALSRSPRPLSMALAFIVYGVSSGSVLSVGHTARGQRGTCHG
jgi:hypothetical protein